MPVVDERGRAGVVEFLSFDCDATADLEHLLTRLSERHQRVEWSAAVAFNELLLRAAVAGHEAAGGPYALGALCWANALVGPSGRSWVMGFGYNFPVLGAPSGILATPGLVQAPEVASGATPDPVSDVWVLYMFWRSLAPFGMLPEALAGAVRGQGDDALTRIYVDLAAGATSANRATRVQSVRELYDRYLEQRAFYDCVPDPELLLEVFGALAEAPPPESIPIEPGRHVGAGRYRVEHPLGRGATSTVFCAWDRHEERAVALKCLRADAEPTLQQRFRREVRLLRSLDHPHVVRGYDVFEEEGRPVAVMALVVGERLDDFAAHAQTSAEAIRSAVADVAAGLAALHARGVEHRDVKPANIIVGPRGAVLVDLGIAREMDVDPTLTRSGALLGTPAFMAPEQLSGYAGPAADIYSLCRALVPWSIRSRHPTSATSGPSARGPLQRSSRSRTPPAPTPCDVGCRPRRRNVRAPQSSPPPSAVRCPTPHRPGPSG